MPEGDTVWLAARRLHRALAGKPLCHSDFRVPQLATTDLTGRTVHEVVARGKHLLTRVEGDLTVHTHFAMDGVFRVFAAGARWSGGPTWQIRLVLANDTWTAVGYRLPVVELLPTARESDVVGHLGPDVLGADWDLAESLARLGAQPDRAIGVALLDQRNLAGIGNIYRTEAMFLRGLSPWTKVGDVADLAALVERARSLMITNRDHPRGSVRLARAHFVHGRTGKPCRRCGTAVRVAEQGNPGERRLTYWCPACQPGPSPRGSIRPGPRRTG